MRNRYEILFLRTLVLCLIFFGCSVNYADDQHVITETMETQRTRDPLENFNRGIFYFNDKVDVFLVQPIATLYNRIIPKPLNQGIHNIFNNLNTITTIANDILQLHFYQIMNDLWRLGINTTIGVGGLFDVASRMGLKHYSNDFGLTLARWGWKDSIFIMWPLFGPSTLRDGIEIPIDYTYFSLFPYITSDKIRYSIYGVGVIDRRAQLLNFQSVLDEVAIDKYVFMRDAYLQRRLYQIKENQEQGLLHQTKDMTSNESIALNKDQGLKDANPL